MRMVLHAFYETRLANGISTETRELAPEYVCFLGKELTLDDIK